MDQKLVFKPGQIILVRYYKEQQILLCFQHSNWYNGHWAHGFIQLQPVPETATTILITEWEIGAGLVQILEDGSALKVLYGQK